MTGWQTFRRRIRDDERVQLAQVKLHPNPTNSTVATTLIVVTREWLRLTAPTLNITRHRMFVIRAMWDLSRGRFHLRERILFAMSSSGRPIQLADLT